MAKIKTIYACQSCGHNSHKWLGKCPDCGAWNSFLEEKVEQERTGRGGWGGPDTPPCVPTPISELNIREDEKVRTGIGEFDRVLGGGMVPGAAVLIGGDPGIGKSTLMLQAMGRYAASGHSVLYVSAEESPRQIRLRGERLGAISPNLVVYSETSVDKVMGVLKDAKPGVIVIDSVQTVFSSEIESSPGSL